MKKIYLFFFVFVFSFYSCDYQHEREQKQIAQNIKIKKRVHPVIVNNSQTQENSDKVTVAEELGLTNYVPTTKRRFSSWSYDGNIDMIDEACDYNNPYTMQFASKLARRSGVENDILAQSCEIYKFCVKKWFYKKDPATTEYVAKASESIYNDLVGDCDDFAVLMSACILSVGGLSRIVGAEDGQSGHAYAELDITNMDEGYVRNYLFNHFGKSNLAIRTSLGRKWLNFDWGVNEGSSMYPGCAYYKAIYEEYYYIGTDRKWHYANTNGVKR